MKNNVSFDDKLLSACESADIEEVKELLQNGADVNAKNANINLKHNWDEGPDDNSTILACCCYCDEGFPSEEYFYRISLSALMKASEKGHKEVVELLIEKGAKVNQINRENRTPLHFAAENGHLEVVEFLIKKGAKVNRVNKKEGFIYLCRKLGIRKVIWMRLLDVKYDEDGLTALHLASEKGHKEVVKLLIQNGAKVNQINRENRTPLHFAAENGHLEVVTILQSFVDGKDCKNSNFENSSKKKINNSCLPSLQSSTNSNGMRL